MSAAIAPELGRISSPSRGEPYDDIRLALLDGVIEAKVAGRLDQEAWETAFAAAMRSVRLRVLADAETSLRAAAEHSHYPARRLRMLLPDAETADTLLNRLLAEGMPLERFEGMESEPETRRARGAALERSWAGAMRVAATESSRWRVMANGVASWRRPTLPLWILSAGLMLVALVLAAWLSGAVPSPLWFRPVNAFWWRLWP
ncbi:MAG: hypothetical protein ACREK8_06615 [Gemmatimonadales bacterium]